MNLNKLIYIHRNKLYILIIVLFTFSALFNWASPLFSAILMVLFLGIIAFISFEEIFKINGMLNTQIYIFRKTYDREPTFEEEKQMCIEVKEKYLKE